MSTERVPHPVERTVTAASLTALSGSLKDVAARVPPTQASAMGEFTDQDVLASVVEMLEGMASSLGDRQEVGTGMHNTTFNKYPAVQAVRGFIAAWLCRNKERSLPTVFRQLLMATWPGSFGEALSQAVEKMAVRLPSRSSLQRWITVFDVAIMVRQKLVMRTALSQGAALFWGADSSPQHGQDWFLSAYVWVLRQDLPRILAAVRVLQTLPADDVDRRKPAAQVLQCIHMHRPPA